MSTINTKPASGTRDFLPDELRNRERLFATIKSVFGLYGYQPIDTPAFERIETLMGKYGEEGEKLIFKILKRGDRESSGETDFALRYDLTIPFARFVADNRSKLPNIFRRYQIGPVWRADRPGKGRFREFYQCDIDIIGTESPLAEVEIMLAITSVLDTLGLSSYVVRINAREVLAGLTELYGVSESSAKDFFTALDKLDKIGADGVVKEIEERGIRVKKMSELRADLAENNPTVIGAKLSETSKGAPGVSSVAEMVNRVSGELSKGNVEFSPFLARGLDYYTGIIFEVFAPGFSGAIASGGRYDNLIGMFSKQEIPACGGSLGIDRIMLLLEQSAESLPTVSSMVFVTIWDASTEKTAVSLVQRLRKAGVSAELSLTAGKIGNQIKVASQQKIPYCIVQGPDEIAQGAVAVKDLRSGEQRTIALTDLETFFTGK